MSLSLICPTCTETVTFHHGEVNACPHCGVQFDEKLRKQATASLALQTVGRPILITIGGVTTTFACGFTLFMSLMAFLNIGSYTINEEAVTGTEFLRAAGLTLSVTALLEGVLSYAIWTERDWGRPLMLASMVISWAAWYLPFLNGFDPAGLIFAVFFNLLSLGLAAWYLYGTERVKAYYKFLEMKAEAKSMSSTPTAPSASPK